METKDYVGKYFIRDDKIYKCIDLFIQPSILLENVETKKQEVHTIGSAYYKLLSKLIIQ